MEKVFLHVFLFMMFVVFTIPTQAQITLEQSNFPRQGSFQDTVLVGDLTGQMIPSEGTDQIWDYSDIVEGTTFIGSYLDASDDEYYPEALNSVEGNLHFQDFIIQGRRYDSIDEDGFWLSGRVVEDVAFSIGAISGNANDSLRFIGGPVDFEGRADRVKFPMTYLDQWEESYAEIFNFELTVESFGLNKVPGSQKISNFINRSVVGYGQLIIPDYDGTPLYPMDVLLVKSEEVFVDSFFLGGAPAPDQLLSAFGIEQGRSGRFDFFSFYRADFGATVLQINLWNEDPFCYYRPSAKNVTTSVNDLDLISINTFPNPISTGQRLTLQTDLLISSGIFSLYDISGRSVFTSAFDAYTNQEIHIDIPGNLLPGMYTYKLYAENQTMQGSGKLLVK